MGSVLDVTLVNCLLVFGIIAFCGFMHTSTAVGYSIFAMTLMPLLLPFVSAAVINKIAMLALTLMVIGKLRHHIDYKFIIIPTIAALLGDTLGFYVLISVDVAILKVALGAVLILVGLFMFVCNGRAIIKRSTLASIIVGFIAGFMGGLFNLSGIILAVYYFSVFDDKMAYASSIQATMFITKVWDIGLNAIYGNYTIPGTWTYVIIAVVAVIFGGLLGLKVLKKINKATIGKISYSYMIIMGVALVINLEQILKSLH